tara:strand:+ start:106 stop:435 length:330 start_codon:yes stop_codon:yes gene_type:complete
VNLDGASSLLRIVGHAERNGRAQLELRTDNGMARVRASITTCTPNLRDLRTAGLLLAELWAQDGAWHTHGNPWSGWRAHVDPALGDWHGACAGQAVAEALLALHSRGEQ